MKRTLPLLAIPVIAMLLAGCSTADGSPAAKPKAAEKTIDFETVLEPAWSVDVNLASDVETTDDYALAYTLNGSGGINLTAWDVATGDELWSESAVFGAGSRGSATPLEPAIVEDGDDAYAVFLRPDEDAWQKVSAKNIKTGTFVNIDEYESVAWVTKRPAICADGGTESFCFTGIVDEDAGNQAYRVHLASGSMVIDTTTVLPDGATFLGDTVYVTQPENGEAEILGRNVDGASWERPYEDVFGVGTFAWVGFAWAEDVVDGIVIGHAYLPAEETSDGKRVFALANRHTVALNATTGETIWKRENSDMSHVPEKDSDAPILLTRYNAGTITYFDNEDGSQGHESAGGDTDLVALDPKTGKELWVAPLGAQQEVRNDDSIYFGTSDDVVTASRDGKEFSVDMKTGDLTPLADGFYGCISSREFMIDSLTDDSADTPVPHSGGIVSVLCDAEMKPVEGASEGTVKAVGVEASDGLFIIATAKGLTAYKLK